MTRNNDVSIVKRANMLPAIPTKESIVSPSTDVYETPEAFVLMIDLPGVQKKAINVMMENGTLSVRAKIEPYHPEHASLLFSELNATVYHRVFNLGDGIDRDSIDAKYENGVLALKLFKNDKVKPREIQIK